MDALLDKVRSVRWAEYYPVTGFAGLLLANDALRLATTFDASPILEDVLTLMRGGRDFGCEEAIQSLPSPGFTWIEATAPAGKPCYADHIPLKTWGALLGTWDEPQARGRMANCLLYVGNDDGVGLGAYIKLQQKPDGQLAMPTPVHFPFRPAVDDGLDEAAANDTLGLLWPLLMGTSLLHRGLARTSPAARTHGSSPISLISSDPRMVGQRSGVN